MFEATLASKGRGNYVCPPNSGPAWRAAYEAGVDMDELEANLRLTPWERLVKHDKLLNEWLEFEAFMTRLYTGWKFIESKHVHSR
jgi:hypothetical protein